MGMRHVAWVREHSRSQGAARLAMYAMASAADEAKNECNPSVATLARWAGVDVRTAKRAIAHLEAIGEISTTRTIGRVNRYFLTLSEGVALCHPWRSATSGKSSPVTLSVKTSDIQSKTGGTTPPNSIKDTKGVKTDISIPLEVAFALPAETPKAKIDDAAYKGQTAAWVAPTSKREMLAADLWEDVKGELKMQLAGPTFLMYVQSTKAIGWAGDTLQVEVINPYALDWLNGRLISVVGRTMRTIVGEPVKVEFILASEQHAPTITELLLATR